MSIKSKKLDKYQPCYDKNCINKNAVLIKMVYSDMEYVPLCLDCIRKHRRAISVFKKSSINLSDKEISYTYFETLNLI